MKATRQQTGNSNTTSIADSYIVHSLPAIKKTWRHTYHAMPPIGWMNDPNGFCYALGKYHLFYQFYPYGAAWNSMHWGHYTSQDFVKWQLQPTALAPNGKADRDGCYSGSAIEKDGKLYLMYTSVLAGRQTQSLAVSADGVKFEKLGEVITSSDLPPDCVRSDFRDPKVFMRDGMYYVLLGSMSVRDEGQILLYRSPDLMQWEYVNTIRRDMLTTRGIYECPDIFRADGKDVILASPQGYEVQDWRYENMHSSIYMVGMLDVGKGVFDKEYEDEIDGGFDFYAPQTVRTPDGRIVMIAWMQMWSRTMPTAQHGWAGSMILPRELTLRDGKLFQSPVREIERYRWNPVSYANVPLTEDTRLKQVCGTKVELNVTFDLGTAGKTGVRLFKSAAHEVRVYYDRALDKVIFDRSDMGVEIACDAKERDAYVRSVRVSVKDNRLAMRIFLDVSGCEVFLNGGERTMTGNVYSDGCDISFFAEGGDASILSLDKYDIVV